MCKCKERVLAFCGSQRAREMVSMLRSQVGRRLWYNEVTASVVALFGTLCAIGQNEWTLRNNDPLHWNCALLKAANTLVSVLLVLLFMRHYWLVEMTKGLDKHLRYGELFNPDIPISTVLKYRRFWVELFVSCVHLPPFTTGEVMVSMMENIVVYRYEMIFCCWNLLRIYLLWRPFKTWMTSDICNKHIIAAATDISMESFWVIKRIVNSWSAPIYAAFAWTLSIFFFGYVYRCTEATACNFNYTKHDACLQQNAQQWTIYGSVLEKSHDLFIWNAMWLIFVSMTTVGYGDQVPATHG
jgi:hypothetical protein